MKTGTKKIIVWFLILALAGLALDAFLFLAAKNNVEGFHSAQADVANQQSSAEQNHALQDLAESIQPEISSLNSRIVPSDGVAAFIEMIESLARQSGLSVSISSVNDVSDPTDTSGSYQFLTLTVATVGSWSGTHRFLSLIETAPFELDLSSIGLVENGSGGQSQNQNGGLVGVPASSVGAKTGSTGQTWSGQFKISVLQKT
jgi:hypothetical protein